MGFVEKHTSPSHPNYVSTFPAGYVLLSTFLFCMLAASGSVYAQRPADSKPTAPANPGDVTIQDVCAAAVPRESQGAQFQWAPDASSIAYFNSVDTGFGLRLELDAIGAAGADHTVLLSQSQIDTLFPSRVVGDQLLKVPPPRAKVGFMWAPDSAGLLLYSDVSIVWLDRKTLKTRSLVSGKEPINDVQLSPDGRWAAFARDHNLWIVNIANGTTRAITSGGDDTLLKGELDWLYPTELGTTHAYAWSPDSSQIAYLEFNLKGVQKYTPPLADEDDQVETIDYPTPGRPNPQVRAFVTALNGKVQPVAIDTGAEKEVYLPRLQWLPGGKRIAIERLNRAQDHLDLLFADARTGVARIILTESDPYWINLTQILYFLKDAPQFVWASERTGYRHLYLYSLDGKPVTQLTDGQWEVTSLDAVDEHNHRFYYTSTEKSSLERHLYSERLDGTLKRRVSGDSGTHEAVFAPNFSAYVDSFSTALKPWLRTVYKINADSSDPTNAATNSSANSTGGKGAANRIFALDELPMDARKPAFQPVDFITVKTHEGVEMNALLIRPPNFVPDKKYPSIVYVSGRPGGQSVRDAWDGEVSMWRQMLAQRGFVIFSVDNRGTVGKGHAFEEYVHLRFEGQEMADQKDAVRFLQTLPYVDPARTGIWGRGFGGALAVNGMLKPPLLFKAGFAIAPIVDWELYDSAFTERYLGDPVKNQDGYLSSSPLDEWQRYKGPMFVGQGLDDLLVHPEQTMELQEDLVEKGQYVEISLFPGQGHNIDSPNACKVLYQRATDFFAKSL